MSKPSEGQIQQGIAWHNKFLTQFEGMDADVETLAYSFSYGLAARDEEVADLQDYKNSYTEGREIISNLKADLASGNSMCMHSDLERDKAVADLAGARVAYQGQCAALEVDIKHWRERAHFSEGACGALEPQLKQAEALVKELEGEVAQYKALGNGADGEAVDKLVQLRKYVGKLELKLGEAIPIAESIDPDPYPQPAHVFEFVESAKNLLGQKNAEASTVTRDRVKELEDERSELTAELSLLYDLWVGVDDPRAVRAEVGRLRDKLALAEARAKRLESGQLPELED